jgi:hypothetical protein
MYNLQQTYEDYNRVVFNGVICKLNFFLKKLTWDLTFLFISIALMIGAQILVQKGFVHHIGPTTSKQYFKVLKVSTLHFIFFLQINL